MKLGAGIYVSFYSCISHANIRYSNLADNILLYITKGERPFTIESTLCFPLNPCSFPKLPVLSLFFYLGRFLPFCLCWPYFCLYIFKYVFFITSSFLLASLHFLFTPTPLFIFLFYQKLRFQPLFSSDPVPI